MEISIEDLDDDINFDEMCRICMGYHNKMLDIFEVSHGVKVTARDLLTCLTEIEIDAEDKLPQKICRKCEIDVNVAIGLKERAEVSDQVLRKILKKQEIAKEPEKSILNLEIETVDHLIEPTHEEEIGVEEESQEVDLEYCDYEIEEDIDNEEIQYLDSEIIKSKPSLDESSNIENIVKGATHSCEQCSQWFTEKSELVVHMRKIHKKFMCSVCNYIFKNSQTLSRHKKIHQENQKSKLCTFCGKGFARSDDLKRHIRIHTGERPYECDLCPKSFKQSSELKEHSKSHSTTKSYVCTVCGKVLATRNGIYVHMKVHKGEKNHKCNDCEKSFVTTGELYSHINHIHLNKKHFKCEYDKCTKKFVTNFAMNRHYLLHTTTEKQNKCNSCGKVIKNTENNPTHICDKPMKCTLCVRILKNEQSLRRHMKLHNDEKVYECNICDKKFKGLVALNMHNHKENEFICEICEQMFPHESQLQKHIESHVAEKRSAFTCNMCGLNFNKKITFLKHLATHDCEILPVLTENFKQTQDSDLLTQETTVNSTNENSKIILNISGDEQTEVKDELMEILEGTKD